MTNTPITKIKIRQNCWWWRWLWLWRRYRLTKNGWE